MFPFTIEVEGVDGNMEDELVYVLEFGSIVRNVLMACVRTFAFVSLVNT